MSGIAKTHNRSRSAAPGFAALISVLLVASALISGMAGLSMLAWEHARQTETIMNAHLRRASARACAEYALVRLRIDPAFDRALSLPINGGSCSIDRIDRGNGMMRMIRTAGRDKDGVAVLVTEFDIAAKKIIRQHEE